MYFQGVDAHGESFNAELSTIHVDGGSDPAERERRREQFLARRIAHDMSLLDQEMQQAEMQDTNFNAVTLSVGPSRCCAISDAECCLFLFFTITLLGLKLSLLVKTPTSPN